MALPTLPPSASDEPALADPSEPRARLTALLRGGWGRTSVGNIAAVLLVWVLLVVVTAVRAPDFLSYATLISVAFSMTITGIVAIGLAWVTISGGLVDLSIPASTALAALVTSAALTGLGSWVAALLGIAAGTLFGLVNGLVVVGARLNPIVATLGTNFVGIGINNLLFDQSQLDLSSGLRRLSLHRTLGLPTTWWFMLVLLVVTSLVMARTRYGQHAVAVGGNPLAARRQGIRLPVVRLATFTFMGVTAGIAGVLYCGQTQLLDTGSTNGLLFPAVTTVILSGVSLRGGEGSLPVLLIGMGFLATVPTALVFLGFDSGWQQFWLGALLAAAVAIDGVRQRRRRSR